MEYGRRREDKTSLPVGDHEAKWKEEGDFVWSLLGAFFQFTLPEMHLCCEADIQQRIMLRLYLFKVTENQEWIKGQKINFMDFSGLCIIIQPAHVEFEPIATVLLAKMR